MLASVVLVFLVTVPGFVSAQDPIDLNCTTVNPADGTPMFTSTAMSCQDNNPALCEVAFGAIAALPGTRDPKCFQDATPAPSEDIKRAAIQTCAKHCAFCCVTPEYNCINSPTPRINCGSVTQTMCQSTQWREIIAQDCPSVCGFCLLGGCIDAAPDCATQPTICGNTALTSFIQANCQRTCGLCTSSTTASSGSATTSAGSGTGTCGDAYASCTNWVRNGFCTSTFYSATQKRQFCGQSCGLC